jgi:LCP family protein required for cell wall assembly
MLLFVILVGVSFVMLKMNKINFSHLDSDNLEIYQDTGEFTNIALFGLDASEGELTLEAGARSDAIMIASINNETHEVKVVSVYRDTLLFQKNDTYEKANAAYMAGGPEEAIALLNRNLDMDIDNYVAINFNALIDTIDALGGIEIDVQPEELSYINGYATEIIQTTGKDSVGVFDPGPQVLNGVQATAYTRIRYTDGADMKRAERQRIVLQKIFEKAKTAKVGTLNKMVDKILPQISTSLKSKDLMSIAANLGKFKIGESKGYPFEIAYCDSVEGHGKSSYVVPVGFTKNVVELHTFLFGETDYTPSEKVQAINNDLVNMTGIDENAAPIDLTGIVGQ